MRTYLTGLQNYNSHPFDVVKGDAASANKRRILGPFSVPADDVKLAGFHCAVCHSPVNVCRTAAPTLAARACLFACRCEIAIVAWEDEPQPNRVSWRRLMRRARKDGVKMIIFNDPKHQQPGFSGLN
jgi:hypothetical protein